jgi:hypothetical protein
MFNKELMEKLYNHKYVSYREYGDLVIFCYTRECQYERMWDDVTNVAN